MGYETQGQKGKAPATVIKTSEIQPGGHLSEYQKELIEWSKNVDKRYAWVVLTALWLAMAMTLGTYRCYGLVYAKITEQGDYNREDASWPISTIITVENTTGPLVSIIASQISFRVSISFGFLFLIVGQGIGYLSSTLAFDIIGIGVVQGVGFAFIFMPFMSAINEYFVRYRNIAFGIALSGGTISVFGWSPFFQWLLDNYHWRVSYLLMSLICCIGLLLIPLFKPNPKPKNPAMAEKASQVSGRSKISQLSARAFSYKSALRRQSSMALRKRDQRNTSIISMNPTATSVGVERRISRTIEEERDSSEVKRDSPKRKNNLKQNSAPLGASERADSISVYAADNSDEPSDTDMELSRILNILKTPGFHVIWVVELIYFWSFSIYNLMMVDYGVDKGCAREDAEQLIVYLSIGEVIGRLGLGALTDLNYLSIRVTTALSMGILGALLCLLTQLQGILLMASFTVAISAFGSLIYVLLNGLLVEYLGEQNVTIGYGMSSFITGLILFFRPYAVGVCRDYLGTYEPLTWSLGFFCLFGSLITFMEPKMTKMLSERKIDLHVDSS